MTAVLKTILCAGGEAVSDAVEDFITPFDQEGKRPPLVGEICPSAIVPDELCDVVCHGLNRQVSHKFAMCKSWDEAMDLFAAYAPRLADELTSLEGRSGPVEYLVAHREWIRVNPVSRGGYVGRFEVSNTGVVTLAKMFGYLPSPSGGRRMCLRIGGAEFQCEDDGTVKDGFLSSAVDCLSQIGGMYVLGRHLTESELELLPYLETLLEWRMVGGVLECGVISALEGSPSTPEQARLFAAAQVAMRKWKPDALHMFDFDLLSLSFVHECDIGLWDFLGKPPALRSEVMVDRIVESIVSSLDWSSDSHGVTLPDIRREIRSAWGPYHAMLNAATLQMSEAAARSMIADIEKSCGDCVRHVSHEWKRERKVIAPVARELLGLIPGSEYADLAFQGPRTMPWSGLEATLRQVGVGVARAHGFRGGTYDPGESERPGDFAPSGESWYKEMLHRGTRHTMVTPRPMKTARWVSGRGSRWVRECFHCEKCPEHSGLKVCLVHDHVEVPMWRRVRSRKRGKETAYWCDFPGCCGGPGPGTGKVHGTHVIGLSGHVERAGPTPVVIEVSEREREIWEELRGIPLSPDGEVADLDPPTSDALLELENHLAYLSGYNGPRPILPKNPHRFEFRDGDFDLMLNGLHRDCCYLAQFGPGALAGELLVRWALFKDTWSIEEVDTALATMTSPFGEKTD